MLKCGSITQIRSYSTNKLNRHITQRFRSVPLHFTWTLRVCAHHGILSGSFHGVLPSLGGIPVCFLCFSLDFGLCNDLISTSAISSEDALIAIGIANTAITRHRAQPQRIRNHRIRVAGLFFVLRSRFRMSGFIINR